MPRRSPAFAACREGSGHVLKRIALRERNPLCLAIGGHITEAGTVRVGDPVQAAQDRLG
jgi:hypothetical protein